MLYRQVHTLTIVKLSVTAATTCVAGVAQVSLTETLDALTLTLHVYIKTQISQLFLSAQSEQLSYL